MFAAWAVATPLFGAPDEPTHVVRAASVVRGEILGRSLPKGYTAVNVPGVYDQMAPKIACWAFRPEKTPSCVGEFSGTSRLTETRTYVGRYPPLYYAIVGLPGLVSTGARGIYLMRLVSAGIAAGLFTLAVVAATRSRRQRLALVGIAFSLTPMVGFLAGTVNPNGTEVAAASCLWMSCLVVFESRARDRLATMLAVVAACVLVLSRGLSPLWLVVILALGAVAALPDYGRSLLTERGFRRPAAVIAVVSVLAGGWIVAARALTTFPVGPVVEGSTAKVAITIMGGTESFLKEAVGVLQWLDTPVPSLTYTTWLVGLATLSLLALVVGHPRQRVALAACAALTLLSPLLQLPAVHTAGLIWQGRYSLPIAVGIPILALYALFDAQAEVLAVVRRLAGVLVVAVGIALLAAFIWAGRRNAVGTSGPAFFMGREDWQPPIPFVFLLLMQAASISSLVVLFFRATGVDDRRSAALASEAAATRET